MSNNKPTAVAEIAFFPNKHIEVRLSGITGITPRTLAIAENLLGRKYREMRGHAVAASHKEAREATTAAARAAEVKEAEYHERRDKELAEATARKLDGTRAEAPVDPEPEPEPSPEPEPEPEPEVEEGGDPEITEVPEAANDETEGSEADTDDNENVA